MATSKASPLVRASARLREIALSYPESNEEFPWGESAFKVKGKVFLFMRADAATLGLSTKLPDSAELALNLTFASPTGYGLGKSGWVSAKFEAGDEVPIEMLSEWVDESYRAVAPKKLLATLLSNKAPDAGAQRASAPKSATTKAAKKRATKREAPKAAAPKKPAKRKPAK